MAGQKNRWFTLMLIPEQGRTVYKFRLPKLTLQILALVASILLIILGVVLFDYGNLIAKVLESRSTRRENVVLRNQLNEIQAKVAAIESNLDRIHSFAAKLRTITNVGTPIAASEAPGISSMTADSGTPQSSGVAQVDDLQRQIGDVSRFSEKQQRFLEQTFDLLKDKTSMLSATPSIMPAQGWLGSGFGYRFHPISNSWKMHEGLDIVAYPGAQVVTSADGTVVFSGTRGEFGKVVVVNHGFGIETLYGHNSQIVVQVGDRVRRGQVIAHVGATGMATGPHVHYEVHVNGVPVDPANYLLN